MTLASTPTSRWAVSARTAGEVLTAGITRPELELVVLGVPGGFSQTEIEGWLSDLAGVASETSRADARSRAIPPLLHHTLTGLLFSHAELWDRLDAPRPCSCAFVDTPDGPSFGWVGEARVHVLVNGDPVEPQWVRVRDESGREARGAVFAPGADVVVSLQYWLGAEGEGAPVANVEAEWDGSAPSAPAANAEVIVEAWPPSAPVAGPVVVVSSLPEPIEVPAPPAPAQASAPPLPESLPQQQPGLTAPAVAAMAAEPVVAASAPAPEAIPVAEPPLASAESAAPSDAADLAVAANEPVVANEPVAVNESTVASEPAAIAEAAPVESTPEPARSPHPVARWLARVMRWGQPAPRRAEPEAEPVVGSDGTPVSVYDSLLSEAVPPTPEPLEQTHIELPPAVPGETPHAGETPAAEHGTFVGDDAPEAVALEPLPASAPEVTSEPVVVSEPAPVASEPAPPASTAPAPAEVARVTPSATPGAFRPSGMFEILGTTFPRPAAPSPVASTPPASPVAAEPAVASEAPSSRPILSEVLREIEAAEEQGMPMLSPPVPAHAADAPIEVDHEPVGADVTFAIPPVPAPAAEPAAPIAPVAPVASRAAEPPSAPPVLAPRVNTPADAAPLVLDPAPPRLRPEPAPKPWPLPAASIVVQAGGGTAPPKLVVQTSAATPAPTPPEAPPMLRVPLPAASAEPTAVAADDGPSPFLEPLAPATPPQRTVRSFAPAPEAPRGFDLRAFLHNDPAVPVAQRPWVWAAGVLLVFVVGWLVGSIANPGADRGGPLMAAARAVGIGGAHFKANINSRPGGAQIEIDGKPQGSRTPATLELPPGAHTVRLLMPGLGAVSVPVQGKKGETITVDESLNGSLEILEADSNVPVAVSIDGKPAGYAPLRIESIEPGLHEVSFTGPGMPAFAQTIQVDVRGTAQLVARPMSAPANGIIQVRATLNDERGASPLSGAQVFVDGELRGSTPLELELPRGPHSLRVTWRGEAAPVQVIDLPGGNQRYASFNFGLDQPDVHVSIVGASRSFTPGQPKLVSASLAGLRPADVSEAWLHTRSPEGLWRRSAMTLVHAPGAPVVSGVLPDNGFDRSGTLRWYVSVITPQGDEWFSDMQVATPAGAAKPAAKPATKSAGAADTPAP